MLASTLPEVVTAKLSATVDHIANGRFAINVVCGHAGQALDGLVGAPQLDHDEWYAYADEWIEILARQPGPWDPVQKAGELHNDEQVRANNYILHIDAGDGRTVSLKDLAGTRTVLYFFPKADTSG